MPLSPERKEYQLNGRELVHLPTDLPMEIAYFSADGTSLTVKHRERDMGDYRLKDVLDLGVRILMERGR